MIGGREVVDKAIETSVVGSFTRIGPVVRRLLWRWEDVAELAMDGRRVLITGGSSGLGLATATRLAGLGARIRIMVRDRERGLAALSTIASGSSRGATADLSIADLSDLGSIRDAARQIRDEGEPIDVLIHNAGALLPGRATSVDGHEMTFATMVLGPHLLTSELLPVLERSTGARVLWVSSGGMYTQRLDVDALEMGAENYRGSVAYARAKRAQVELAREWAHHLRDRRIVVHAMHPGWVDTPGLRAGLPAFSTVMHPLLRSVGEGIDTLVWLAVAEEPGRSTGRFWLDRRARSTEKLFHPPADPAERRRLWDDVQRLTEQT